VSAENPVRRARTAREMASQFGVNPRTIRALMAEPRDEFLARANQRRAQAVELRSQGMKYREIADEMSISIGTVGSLIHEARRLQQSEDAARDVG